MRSEWSSILTNEINPGDLDGDLDTDVMIYYNIMKH